MSCTPKKIAFCFPYRGVGGVSLLFVRIATEIAKKNNIEVFVVDYEDGFMAKHKPDSVGFILYSDNAPCYLPNGVSVVFQTMTPWSIFPSLKFHNDTKLFFWNCHPYNLVPHVPLIDEKLKSYRIFNRLFLKTILYPYWKKCRRFLELLIARDAISFMDASNKSVTEFFYFSLNISEYLPIPAVLPDNLKTFKKELTKADIIKVTWVGRIVDFKYFILKYTLRELDKICFQIDREIVFTVIGGGGFDERLKSDAKNLKYINVEYIEHIEPDVLDQYLCDNCDLMFAMGTSALEAAKLSIPTVLLDVFYSELKGCYQYRFLFERDGSTLGDVLNGKDLKRHIRNVRDPYNVSLMNIFKQLQDDYGLISKKTKDYFLKNHDIKQVSNDLLEKIKISRCTYKDLKETSSTERGVFYRLKKILN
ncbi:MAG: hypothetical protein RPR97_02830 [Colwellia sp.]